VPPAAAGADESESTLADSTVPAPGRYAGDVEPVEAGLPAGGGGFGAGAAQAASSNDIAAAQRRVLDFMPKRCSLRAGLSAGTKEPWKRRSVLLTAAIAASQSPERGDDLRRLG